MLPAITKHIIYPTLQFLRREHIYKHLRELESSQWLNPDELKRKQWKSLQNLLATVYKYNDYYKLRFDAAGITNCSINGYEDFQKLPILEKEELRKNAEQMVSRIKNERVEIKKTSGSTGIPLEILKSRDMAGRIRALFHRYYKWHGVDIGDKQARFFGHPVTLKAKFKENIQDFLLNKYRLDPLFLTQENMLTFYNLVKKVKPKYLYGYPSAIYEFARFVKESSFGAGALRPAVVIVTGETLYGFQKNFIEDVFRTKVVNEYGCSEVGIIAFECSEGRLHLSSDNLFVEILRDGKPAKPGEAGEVVVTELFNYTSPLIRYNVGDIATVSENPLCRCARGLTCIDYIEGRKSQFIQLSDGRRVHSELFHYIADGLKVSDNGIKQFRVIQSKQDSFIVQYVSDTEIEDYTKNYLISTLKRYLGEKINLKLNRVQSIERDSSGKLSYFVSTVNYNGDTTEVHHD